MGRRQDGGSPRQKLEEAGIRGERVEPVQEEERAARTLPNNFQIDVATRSRSAGGANVSVIPPHLPTAGPPSRARDRNFVS